MMAGRQRFAVPPGWAVPERSLQDAQALGVVISMPLLMLVFDVVVGGGSVVLSVWAWAFAGIALLLASGVALDRGWAGRRMQIATGFLVGCCFITFVALASYFVFT